MEHETLQIKEKKQESRPGQMRAFQRDLQENLLIGLWESQNKYLKIRLPTAIYSTAACKNSLDNLLLAVLSEARTHTHCA